jgi:hypothetical protein
MNGDERRRPRRTLDHRLPAACLDHADLAGIRRQRCRGPGYEILGQANLTLDTAPEDLRPYAIHLLREVTPNDLAPAVAQLQLGARSNCGLGDTPYGRIQA